MYRRSYFIQLTCNTHKKVYCNVVYTPHRNAQSSSNIILSFNKVSYEYVDIKPILNEASFNVRIGAKYTIMGQNGSGKSTMMKLINGELQPSSGSINMKVGTAVSTARQVMPREYRDLTVMEYFMKVLQGNSSGLASRVAAVLQTVQLDAPYDRQIKSFSGGQQARLLLAAALIIDPDILLLDEPTNNLDVEGVDNLRNLICMTDKTCIVVSHDEEFLNSFTDSVLYIDNHSKKVEQYEGDYNTVKNDIVKRIQRENTENARLMREAIAKKEQAGVFANKGGGMRKMAKKLREEAEVLTEQKVSVRREDKSISTFEIPCHAGTGVKLLEINAITLPPNKSEPKERVVSLKANSVRLDKGNKLRIIGPNGIGKTTLLEKLAMKTTSGIYYNPEAEIGYYRQDFNTLDFDSTVLKALENASNQKHTAEELRKIATGFLLKGDIVKQKIATLSEGQKGLLSFACLVLQEPAILVVDEPTNHINFRHFPNIIDALNKYEGGLIIVSHDEDFMSQIGVDDVIDLQYERKLL